MYPNHFDFEPFVNNFPENCFDLGGVVSERSRHRNPKHYLVVDREYLDIGFGHIREVTLWAGSEGNKRLRAKKIKVMT